MYLIVDDTDGKLLGYCDTVELAREQVEKEATGPWKGHTFYVALVVAESRVTRKWSERT